MKLLNVIRMAVLLAILITTSSNSYAQTAEFEDSGLYLGPQIGVFKAADADNTYMTGGVALRIKVMEFLGFEGAVNYRQEKYADDRVTVKSWPVMVTGLLYPLPYLYAAIGAGWYNTNYSYNNSLLGLDYESDTQQEFGWHFGAGVELPVGEIGKIVGDVRYVFLNYDFQKFPGSEDRNANYVLGSVSFLFKL